MHHAVTQTILCFLNTPPLKINDRLSNLHEFNYVLCRPHIPTHTDTLTSTYEMEKSPIPRWRMSGEKDYTVIVIDVRNNCFCCVQLCMRLSSSRSALVLQHTFSFLMSLFINSLFLSHFIFLYLPSHQFHQVNAESLYSFHIQSLSLARAQL